MILLMKVDCGIICICNSHAMFTVWGGKKKHNAVNIYEATSFPFIAVIWNKHIKLKYPLNVAAACICQHFPEIHLLWSLDFSEREMRSQKPWSNTETT